MFKCTLWQHQTERCVNFSAQWVIFDAPRTHYLLLLSVRRILVHLMRMEMYAHIIPCLCTRIRVRNFN